MFCFGPHHRVCGIFVSWPGTEPKPTSVKAQSPEHWTSREVPAVTLDTTPKTQFKKEITGKMDFVTIENFCSAKDGIERI